MNIQSIFKSLAIRGIWRADILEKNMSNKVVIIVPNQQSKRRVGRLIDIMPAFVDLQVQVDPKRFRGRKKHTYNVFMAGSVMDMKVDFKTSNTG